MSSKFLNIDTDSTLARNSDTAVASQKAVKTYVDTAISNINVGSINTAIIKKAKAWENVVQVASGDTVVMNSTSVERTFPSVSVYNTGFFKTGKNATHFILFSNGELYIVKDANMVLVSETAQRVKHNCVLRQDGSLFSGNINASGNYVKSYDSASSGLVFTDFAAGESSTTMWGISGGAIYYVSSSVVLLNDNRTWVNLWNLGDYSTNNYLLASDLQNRLYLVSSKNTNQEIDLGITYNQSVICKGGRIDNYYYLWAIIDGALYQLGNTFSKCALLNNTETWVDCVNDASHSFAITSTGKLYRGMNGGAISQVGTDTNWQALGGGTRDGFGALKGGNLYSLRSSGTLDWEQLTTSGNFTSVYGGYSRQSSSSTTGGLTFGGTGANGQMVYQVFTNLDPQVGDKTYSSYNPPEVSSTITAVDAVYVTDGNRTYQRKINQDQVFTSLTDEMRNKSVTIGVLLDALGE